MRASTTRSCPERPCSSPSRRSCRCAAGLCPAPHRAAGDGQSVGSARPAHVRAHPAKRQVEPGFGEEVGQAVGGVDRFAQPLALGLDHLGGHLGPPRASDAIALLGHPLVTAGAQHILGLNGRVERPQAHRLGPRALAQHRERGALDAGQSLREQPHAGLAVGERAVAVAGECAVMAQQAVQRIALRARLPPRNLESRARPGLVARRREHALEEGAVEARIVRDEHVGALNQCAGGRLINVASAHRVVGEPGERGNRFRNRAPGVAQVCLGLIVQDLCDLGLLVGVGEGQEPDLDDLVARRVETGGLAVDVEAAARRCAAGVVHHRGQRERAQGAGSGGVVGIHHGLLLLGMGIDEPVRAPDAAPAGVGEAARGPMTAGVARLRRRRRKSFPLPVLPLTPGAACHVCAPRRAHSTSGAAARSKGCCVFHLRLAHFHRPPPFAGTRRLHTR